MINIHRKMMSAVVDLQSMFRPEVIGNYFPSVVIPRVHKMELRSLESPGRVQHPDGTMKTVTYNVFHNLLKLNHGNWFFFIREILKESIALNVFIVCVCDCVIPLTFIKLYHLDSFSTEKRPSRHSSFINLNKIERYDKDLLWTYKTPFSTDMCLKY